MPNIQYNFLNSYDSLPVVNVPIRVTDTTGKDTLSCFCGGIGRIIVYPEFHNLPPSLNFIENWGYYIDFGDGTIVKELTASHIYQTPGEYNITLVVADSGTNLYKSTTQPTVVAINLIPDTITITPLSSNIIRSSTVANPFLLTRFNSFQSYPSVSATGYTIRLSVSGNKSKFQTNRSYEADQYSHLKLFSCFLSGDEMFPITQIKTTNTHIYAQINPLNDTIVFIPSPEHGIEGVESYFVGTSGTATFYYYEDYS